MDTDIRERAAELHRLIIGSTTSRAWSDSRTNGGSVPDWQLDVVSKILTLAYDQDILYLSTALPDAEDWDVIAFTDSTVVRVSVSRVDGVPSHVEASAFPRSSLESLELMDVAPIPSEGENWPIELNLLGHYKSVTIALPLDKFSSSDNKRDLVKLLTSLLQDISH